jgi:hypothetical protein
LLLAEVVAGQTEQEVVVRVVCLRDFLVLLLELNYG